MTNKSKGFSRGTDEVNVLHFWKEVLRHFPDQFRSCCVNRGIDLAMASEEKFSQGTDEADAFQYNNENRLIWRFV